MAERVTIVETLRDAWQGLPRPVPTEAKRAFIQRLVDAGFDRLDVGSFVSRGKVPAMADTDVLLEGVRAPGNVVFTALVANERGLDRLLAVDVIGEALFPFSLSETFGRRNIGQGRAESLATLQEIARRAHDAERSVYVTVSMAFGNNEGDPWSPREVAEWVARLHDAGADRVGLADTTAQANAAVLAATYAEVTAECGDPAPGAHLHVTPENQESLVGAALQAGCRSFDAALGGLGGCQFARGAVSNVSTARLVAQLGRLGFTTNVPVDGLAALDAGARRLAAS